MKWGILGTGKIAGKFAAELSDEQVLAAVGSRRLESASAFCDQFGGRPHPSYESLLDDKEVEAVYISLPNSLHHPWTIKSLRAGKHVLCEKPIAATETEAAEMFEVAQAENRTLVEAFMYRTHPAIQHLLQQVRAGAIGEVRLIRSNFTFQRDASQQDVRYQPDLKGGSLMDVGCYPINFSRAIAGREPTETQAMRRLHAFGVDEYVAGLLRFGDGPLAAFTCGMTVQADRATTIGGETGYIQIDDPWFTNGRYEIVRKDGVETFNVPAANSLYGAEADRFAEVVAGAEPWITADDSLGNMRVLDRIRADWQAQQTQGS